MSDIARNSMLYLDDVSVAFDGFKAINGLSIVLAPCELRAVIGPNGAGKTTMMDIVTGKTRPDTGTALFDETVDLTSHDEASIARLGIGRKFQKPTVFETHTVTDNLLLALAGRRGVWETLTANLTGAERDRIDEILATIRLTERRADLAANLSHGQKQWLEIGMLLAQDPKLLLVDEPVAGMTDGETDQTAELLTEISANHTVMVVEHDMPFIKALDCKVSVLHEGRVIAEGSFERVSTDDRVVDIYLGR